MSGETKGIRKFLEDDRVQEGIGQIGKAFNVFSDMFQDPNFFDPARDNEDAKEAGHASKVVVEGKGNSEGRGLRGASSTYDKCEPVSGGSSLQRTGDKTRKFCSDCGAGVGPKAKFCAECGEKVGNHE